MNCSYLAISSLFGWPNSFIAAASHEPEPPSSPRPAIQPCAAPRPAMQRVILPAALRRCILLHRDGAARLADDGSHLVWVVQEQVCTLIHRNDVTGDADGHGPAVRHESSLDIANLGRDQK